MDVIAGIDTKLLQMNDGFESSLGFVPPEASVRVHLRLAAGFLACNLLAVFPALAQNATAPAVPATASVPANSQPRCKIEGSRRISIACDYSPIAVEAGQGAINALALDHAELAFKANDDNWMSLTLKFTRLDSAPIAEGHLVYIAIDDDSGKNFIRRPLPDVNLAELIPGKSTEFKEHLLFPALQPGRYQVSLWMPSVDSMYRFNTAHNLLVSSFGVADDKTGLNTIATFSVTR